MLISDDLPLWGMYLSNCSDCFLLLFSSSSHANVLAFVSVGRDIILNTYSP
uniref:Uncharacterized protein n=1 Tax=Rhizophora mucronata TaxID=61149 RepID=A0A2P2MYL3_RHIMU